MTCFLNALGIAHQISEYGKAHHGYSDVGIAMSSTLLQKDRYSCIAFTMKAAKFYAKNPGQVTAMVDRSCVKGNEYQARNNVFIDGAYLMPAHILPPGLMKMCQYKTVKEMDDFTEARLTRMKGPDFAANVPPEATITADLKRNLVGFPNHDDIYAEHATKVVSHNAKLTLRAYIKENCIVDDVSGIQQNRSSTYKVISFAKRVLQAPSVPGTFRR